MSVLFQSLVTFKPIVSFRPLVSLFLQRPEEKRQVYERHKSSLLQLEREQVRDQVWQKHPPSFHRHVQMPAM